MIGSNIRSSIPLKTAPLKTAPVKTAPVKAALLKSDLLNHPDLWQAGQLATTVAQDHASTHSSGFSALDAELTGGGWPRAGLAEILHDQQGLGELQILAPALAAMSMQENRWVAWIQPPAIPYAPALEQRGINSQRMLMIHPKTHADALWAAEQALSCGNCSAVLIWLDEAQLKHQHTRRLQIAAKRGASLACLFRHTDAQQQASAAQLRIALHTPAVATNSAQHLQIDIIKRRGGWARQGIELQLNPNDPVQQEQALHEQISIWQSKGQAMPLASGFHTTAQQTTAQQATAQTDLITPETTSDSALTTILPELDSPLDELEQPNVPDYIKRLSNRLEQVRRQREALLESSRRPSPPLTSGSAGYRLH